MAMILWISLFFVAICHAIENGIQLVPLPNSRSGWAYQGHLNENERDVKLIPELKATSINNRNQSKEICGFPIHHEGTSVFPFMVIVSDKQTGLGQIKLKPEIQFQQLNDRYTFQIEAVDCDSPPHFSERRFVLIEVGSINGPQFMKPAYEFTINSSLSDGAKIGEVTAFERPLNVRPDQMQGICKYDIVSPHPVPFSVDQYGNLHSSHLSIQADIFTKYRFYVRATDCDKFQPRKASVPIIVNVYDTCRPHWTGIPTNLKYIRNSGVMPIIANMPESPRLHLCPNSCSNFTIELIASLTGNQMMAANSQQCKHDSVSLKKQAKICEASIDAIDMLQTVSPTMIDSSSGAFVFDASNYVPIQINLARTNNQLGKSFSLSFWMKHGPMGPDDGKQQILCNSDGQVMNRHHYSLFLHNCKLIVLIRKEHWEVISDQYQPTEWRFGQIKEICDDQWHHYGLTFTEGTPMVQIDGEKWPAPPEQLIEKPLKKLDGNDVGTRLTVGSCFHSKTGTYAQHFKGSLAGMRLLTNRVEPVNTIRCMATCGEALLLPHVVEVIDKASSVTLFSQYSIMRSRTIGHLLLMFSKLSYINGLPDRAGGAISRNVAIDTEIKCTSGSMIRAPQHIIHLTIVEPSPTPDPNDSPSILIYSQSHVEGFVKKPILLFPSVKFVQTNSGDKYLESCIVRPVDHPIRSWEYLNWPHELAISHHLTSLNNSHGLILEARQPMTIYELLLRRITFVTQKSDGGKRKFGLTCAIRGKAVTNEVINEVTIRDEDLSTYYVVDDQYEQIGSQRSNGHNILHSANDRRNFEDKLLLDEKLSKKPATLTRTSKILWITMPIVIVLLIVCGLTVVIYRRKQKSRPINIRTNVKQRKTLEYRMEHIPCEISRGSHGGDDGASITSDCPDSNDECDAAALDAGPEQTPKCIYSTYTDSSVLRGQPVDV